MAKDVGPKAQPSERVLDAYRQFNVKIQRIMQALKPYAIGEVQLRTTNLNWKNQGHELRERRRMRSLGWDQNSLEPTNVGRAAAIIAWQVSLHAGDEDKELVTDLAAKLCPIYEVRPPEIRTKKVQDDGVWVLQRTVLLKSWI